MKLKDLKTYLIPALLTFIVSFSIWQIQKDRLELSYQIIDSESFPINNNMAKFFVIKLENTGNKEIEEIQIDLSFQNCFIENFKVSPFQNESLSMDSATVSGLLPYVAKRL